MSLSAMAICSSLAVFFSVSLCVVAIDVLASSTPASAEDQLPSAPAPTAEGAQSTAKPTTAKHRPGPPLIDETTRWSRCMPVNGSIYDFNVETLQGEMTDLSNYKGDVLLVINVATFCAYTQQYNDFGPLLEQHSTEGLKIVGFPCNQFYLQEPAENHELINGIHHVRPGNGFQLHQNMHIYGKLEVNGDNQHPLYEFLKDSCPQTVVQLGHSNELMYNPIRVNDITWNFEKFLVDRHGQPRFRFHPTAWSHGHVLQPFLEQLLAEKAH